MKIYWFLSYSRADFHFAESLAVHLTRKGVSVWLDAQQLHPGDDWSQAIDQGLENCRGVILLASPESMNSPYVRKEWLFAQDNQLPVIVATVRTCEKHPELHPQAVIDMRINFKQGLRRLIEAQATVGTDTVDEMWFNKRRIVGIVPRLPLLIYGLMLIPLITVLIFFYSISASHSTIDVFSVTGYYGSFLSVAVAIPVMYRLPTRKLSFMPLQFAMFFPILFTMLLLKPDLDTLLPWLITIVIVILVAVRALFSGDLFRWLEMENVPLYVRRRHIRDPQLKAKQAELDPVKQHYALHYRPEDIKIAEELDKALSQAGHILVEPEEEADYHFAIITKFMSTNKIKALRDRVALVPVLADNVNVAAQLPEMARHQWIEYRNRNRQTLRAFASLLSYPSLKTLENGMCFLPLSQTRAIVPASVRGLSTYLLIQGMGLVAASVFQAGTSIIDLLKGEVWVIGSFNSAPCRINSTGVSITMAFGIPRNIYLLIVFSLSAITALMFIYLENQLFWRKIYRQRFIGSIVGIFVAHVIVASFSSVWNTLLSLSFFGSLLLFTRLNSAVWRWLPVKALAPSTELLFSYQLRGRSRTQLAVIVLVQVITLIVVYNVTISYVQSLPQCFFFS